MFRLGKTGVALLTAALVPAYPALAERPRYVPPSKAGRQVMAQPAGQPETVTPAAAPDEVKVVVIDEAQAREWELQIELDLMADPVTFPFNLKCLAGQNGMEVRGYVPNALVRDRALATARKACPMEVASGMVMQPNMVYGSTGIVTFDAVQSRLAKLNTAGISLVEVQVGPNGQVILSGRASSLEEKATFSRHLRGLLGCSCVRNEMMSPPGTVAVPVITAAMSPAIPQPMPNPAPMNLPAQIQVAPPPTLPAQNQVAPAAPTRNPAPAAPWSPAPPAVPPGAVPGRVSMAPTENKGGADHSNPLLPPPGTRSATAPRPPAEVAQMPPAPVAPYRPTEARVDAGNAAIQAAAREDRGSKVVPAASETFAQPRNAPPAPEAKTTVATLSARNQQALTQRLRTTLGAAVRNLEMAFDGKGGVKVIVTVPAKGQDLDKVATTIVQAPELKDFDVSLEMRLDP